MLFCGRVNLNPSRLIRQPPHLISSNDNIRNDIGRIAFRHGWFQSAALSQTGFIISLLSSRYVLLGERNGNARGPDFVGSATTFDHMILLYASMSGGTLQSSHFSILSPRGCWLTLVTKISASGFEVISLSLCKTWFNVLLN